MDDWDDIDKLHWFRKNIPDAYDELNRRARVQRLIDRIMRATYISISALLVGYILGLAVIRWA